MKIPTCDCISTEAERAGIEHPEFYCRTFAGEGVSYAHGHPRELTLMLSINFCPQCGKEYKVE